MKIINKLLWIFILKRKYLKLLNNLSLPKIKKKKINFNFLKNYLKKYSKKKKFFLFL